MMYEQGDVVVLPFPFVGERASKLRPALVVSRDFAGKRFPGDIVIAPITSQIREQLRPGEFLLPADEQTGLKVASVARLDTLMTLPSAKIAKRIGDARQQWPAIMSMFKEVFALA